MRMTLEDNVKFDMPVWEKSSANCKRLVTDMLQKDITKRISLDQAVAYPFFDSVRNLYVPTKWLFSQLVKQLRDLEFRKETERVTEKSWLVFIVVNTLAENII